MEVPDEVKKRFYDKVDKTAEGGCWLWTGYRTPLIKGGHGQSSFGGKKMLTHRFSYLTNVGTIAKGLLVRHKCRNSNCCNPEHLELGTPSQNQLDRHRDGTIKTGSNHYASKLTDEQVKEIINSDERVVLIAEKYGIHRNYVYRLKRGDYRNKPTPVLS